MRNTIATPAGIDSHTFNAYADELRARSTRTRAQDRARGKRAKDNARKAARTAKYAARWAAFAVAPMSPGRP